MSYINENGTQPTSVSQWRTNRYKLFTLPSGNVMKLKRVGLVDLIAGGRIPDTLSALAAQVVSKSNLKQLSVDDLKQYAEIVNQVVIASAEEPKVTKAAGGDNTLGIGEIDWVDRVQIFNWANGAANALRPFRPEPERAAKAP